MGERAKAGQPPEWPTVERRKPGWATDWQSSVEREKALLAESLHDNTGSLLIAAVMDLSWSASHLRSDDHHIRERLARARSALEVAIDLNRRTIEELRPTLLDNFGLIAALKWHMAEACKVANVHCEHHFPDPAPSFTPAASIGLYRVGQTVLALMVCRHASSIALRLSVDAQQLTLQMDCDGLPDDFDLGDKSITDALASVIGRLNALGGKVRVLTPRGGVQITCQLPVNLALTDA